jgi:hypothetical protein
VGRPCRQAGRQAKWQAGRQAKAKRELENKCMVKAVTLSLSLSLSLSELEREESVCVAGATTSRLDGFGGTREILQLCPSEKGRRRLKRARFPYPLSADVGPKRWCPTRRDAAAAVSSVYQQQDSLLSTNAPPLLLLQPLLLLLSPLWLLPPQVAPCAAAAAAARRPSPSVSASPPPLPSPPQRSMQRKKKTPRVADGGRSLLPSSLFIAFSPSVGRRAGLLLLGRVCLNGCCLTRLAQPTLAAGSRAGTGSAASGGERGH